jgi:hypothetical protein
MAQNSEREVFASVIRKGTTEIRKKYYDLLGGEYTVDPNTEVFTSLVWGKTKAYSLEELHNACKCVGFKSFDINSADELGFIVIGKK